MRSFPALVLSLLLAVTPAFADLYQWSDKEGVIHITDSMEKVPQEYRGKARVFKETGRDEGPQLDATPPPPPAAEPGQVIFGEHTLEWWRQALVRKKKEMDEVQSAISAKTQFVDVFEGGRRFGQVYSAEQVAKYNLYKEELPRDSERLAGLTDEFEELQRRARIAGVPREVRELK